MNCFICNVELQQEMILTKQDIIISGYYAIVIKNTNIAICSDCYRNWNRVLEFLISRFREQKHIDETICQKILEEREET